MISNSLKNNALPSSFRDGVINLICKDINKKDSINSWRPITLLNTDYKIVAKAVTRRINCALNDIINPSQTCAVPGRSVHQNLTALRDVITYANLKNLPACILSFDQRKAFDVISRPFIFACLDAFGFGPNIQGSIASMYDNIQSRVCVNGHISDSFPVERGIRQGCPLSPALYVLCIETLANSMRADPLISGISLPGNYSENFCECLHADDVSAVLTSDLAIRRTMDAFNVYGAASGSELNHEKSQLLWIGAWKHRTDSACGIKPTSTGVKILGITFDSNGPSPRNWVKMKKRVQDSADKMKRIGAPFSAKSTIINSVLCPLFWFLAAVSPPTAGMVHTLESICSRFFWYPKHTESVSRANLRLPKSEGGWSLPDIETFSLAQGITLTTKTLSTKAHKGYYFCRYLLGSYCHHLCNNMKDQNFPKSSEIPLFYRSIINSAMKIQKNQPVRVEDITAKDIQSFLRQPGPPPKRTFCFTHVINWSTTWEHVFNKCTEARRRDLNWKIAHNVLPVRHNLQKHGISASSRCPYCPCEETFEHAFTQCLLPAGVWRAVANTFGIPTLSAASILFFDPIPVTSDLINQFILLCTESKYQLWLARNKAVFENKRLVLSDLLNNIRSQIFFRMRCELQRLGHKAFARKWTSPPIICRITGNDIDLLF